MELQSITIKLTSKQLETFHESVSALKYILSKPSIRENIKVIYEQNISSAEIQSVLIKPLEAILSKATNKSEKKADKEKSTGKKLTYFTKPQPSNKISVALYNSVKAYYDKAMKYDPNIEYCTSDLNAILYFYIKAYCDVSYTGEVTFHGILCDLIPMHVSDNLVVEHKDIRKFISNLIKYIVNF